MKKNELTSEERFYIRAQLKRESEDAYVFEQGVKLGIEQAIEQRRQEEREKLEAEKAEILQKVEKLDTARKLISRGMQIEDIAEVLGLTIEAISDISLNS